MVAGIDIGQCGGGAGAPADDPLMATVGPQNLGQPHETVLFVCQEPTVVPVADAFMVRSAADDETADVAAGHAEAASRAAWGLVDLLVADSGSRRIGSPIVPSGGIAWTRADRLRPVKEAGRGNDSGVQ